MDETMKIKVKTVKAKKIKTVKAKAKATQQQKQVVNIRIGDDTKKKRKQQRKKKTIKEPTAQDIAVSAGLYQAYAETLKPKYTLPAATPVSASNIDKELIELRKELASLKNATIPKKVGTSKKEIGTSIENNILGQLLDTPANIPNIPNIPASAEKQELQVEEAAKILAEPAQAAKRGRGRPRKSEAEKLKQEAQENILKGDLSSTSSEGFKSDISRRTRSARAEKKFSKMNEPLNIEAQLEKLIELRRQDDEAGYMNDITPSVPERKKKITGKKIPTQEQRLKQIEEELNMEQLNQEAIKKIYNIVPQYLGSPSKEMPPSEEEDTGKKLLTQIKLSPEAVAARNEIYKSLGIFQQKQ